MKLSFSVLAVLSLSFSLISCSSEEQDGRQYFAGGSVPVQGRMGVQHKRMRTPEGEPGRVDDGTLFGRANNSGEPAGLLDRNAAPEEEGVKYRIKAKHSPNPAQSRMGVRVSREKITE